MNKRGQQQGMVNTQTVPQKNSGGGKKIPGLIKFLAVLYYIGAGFAVFAGIAFMLLAGSISLLIPALAVLSTFGVLIGVGIIGFAVLLFFLGRGFWKGKNWARIVAIIIYGISIIASIIALILGNFEVIVDTIFSGLIMGYLLFNKKVKEAFA